MITLTTDFGIEDAYVPAMKGVILSICPDVRLVDITHEISPQDIMEAAFVLREAVPYFPDGTVHLVVVDPGVGTERRPVALRAGDRWFVGADNGLFPLVLDGDSPEAIVRLDNRQFWRTPDPSTTFHGRDIFAPVAAHLAAGHALEEIGSPIESLKPLRWAQPRVDDDGIQGWIAHIDHFGNCITNISKQIFDEHVRESDRSFKCFVGNHRFTRVHATYGAADEGEPLLLFGSSGYLEVAVNAGNGAEHLDIRTGDSVDIVYQD